jgi:hypothetical protein
LRRALGQSNRSLPIQGQTQQTEQEKETDNPQKFGAFHKNSPKSFNGGCLVLHQLKEIS